MNVFLGNVWFVTSDTVFPCIPCGTVLYVIQQSVAQESNRYNNGFRQNSFPWRCHAIKMVIGMFSTFGITREGKSLGQ